MSSDTATMTVEKGYKVTEIGVIPEEWEVVTAGKIFDNVTIKNYPQERLLTVTQESGAVFRDECGMKIQSNEKNWASFKLVTPGNFIISLRSFQGGIEYSTIRGIVSPAYTVLTSKINIIDDFFRYYLKSPNFINKLSSSVIGIRDGKQISFSVFKELPVPLPPLPEQEKIAEILSTVDEHIGETEDLIEKTETLKRGMMQKLLTQGIGHTKFKDTEIGRIPAEWEVAPLKTFIKKVTKKNKENKVSKVVSVTKHHGIVDSLSYFKNQVFSNNLTTYKIVKKGEFAFSPIHLNEGSIGYLQNTNQALLSPMYSVFSVDEKIADNYFLFSILKQHRCLQLYSTMAAGSVERRGTVSFALFSGILIQLPPLPEQEKIAEILTAIDDQIDAYRSKLEALNRLKTGLMQQLLTGRIRVRI